MRVLEFLTQMNPDHTLTVPRELAELIGGDQALRVVLLVAESSEDEDWANLARDQFLRGYSEEDAIYDQLSAG